jgi:hypothetical protein
MPPSVKTRLRAPVPPPEPPSAIYRRTRNSTIIDLESATSNHV